MLTAAWAWAFGSVLTAAWAWAFGSVLTAALGLAWAALGMLAGLAWAWAWALGLAWALVLLTAAWLATLGKSSPAVASSSCALAKAVCIRLKIAVSAIKSFKSQKSRHWVAILNAAVTLACACCKGVFAAGLAFSTSNGLNKSATKLICAFLSNWVFFLTTHTLLLF